MQVFNEMKEHSRKDPQCTPNVISYSALMTACCSGGRPDKAHEVFQEMISSGIKPDQISYSTLIAGQPSSHTPSGSPRPIATKNKSLNGIYNNVEHLVQ